jgi:hypothetical protein
MDIHESDIEDEPAGPSCPACGPNKSHRPHTRSGSCRVAARNSDSGEALPAPVMMQSQGPETESDTPDAPAEKRRKAGMYTYSCPMVYCSDAAARRRANKMIPADFTREEIAALLMTVVPPVSLLAVAREPHERRNPDSGEREVHYHVVFMSDRTFAHKSAASKLRAHGVHGRFSFNGAGFVDYLAYIAEQRAGKVAGDLDKDIYCHGFSPDDIPGLLDQQRGAVVKKRSRLSFSEFTNEVVDNDLRDVGSLWAYAKRLKTDRGEDLMYNHIGGLRDAEAELTKVWAAWKGDLSAFPSLRYYQKTAPFPLGEYDLPDAVRDWQQNHMTTHALVLAGHSDVGKTGMAKALLGTHFWFLPTLESVGSVTVTMAHKLLFDEMDLRDLQIDQVKCLFDLENGREVPCRFRNGFIPAKVPRIFTTNRESLEAFCPYHQGPQDWKAVCRRVKFVYLSSTVIRSRRNAGITSL